MMEEVLQKASHIAGLLIGRAIKFSCNISREKERLTVTFDFPNMHKRIRVFNTISYVYNYVEVDYDKCFYGSCGKEKSEEYAKLLIEKVEGHILDSYNMIQDF